MRRALDVGHLGVGHGLGPQAIELGQNQPDHLGGALVLGLGRGAQQAAVHPPPNEDEAP